MAYIAFSRLEHAELRATYEEIESGSDRAAAVVAGSFVEQHLETAIKRRLEFHETLLEDMFRPSGPLGPFSVKISTGFLLGLYKENARKELATIKDIRNAFAHKLEVRDFSNQRMADLTKNLTMVDETDFYIIRPTATAPTISIILGRQPTEDERIYVPAFPPEDNPTPRQRFIRACQFYISVLALAPHLEQPVYKPLV